MTQFGAFGVRSLVFTSRNLFIAIAIVSTGNILPFQVCSLSNFSREQRNMGLMRGNHDAEGSFDHRR